MVRLLLLNISFILCLINSICASPFTLPLPTGNQLKDDPNYRLPLDTIPINYDIELTTNVHKNETYFTGKVKITLKCVKDLVDTIIIHKRQINITKSSVKSTEDDEIDIEKITFDEETEKLSFKLEKTLKENSEYFLTIEYNGLLREDNGGFYKSSYTNENNAEVWLATTQFESTDARHAFPCYDEPGIRASYDIKITHGKNYHAISNMPVIERKEIDDDMVVTTFETIASMQTYLVAFVISDFYSISRSTTNRVPQKLYARPVYIKTGEGDFGIVAGEKILTKIEEYFNVDYTLEKMDQISIPDFQAGAMENWGLVTYREELLMYDSSKHSLNQKRRIASVIAHEFAHQMFGNLVAPAWWSYLWLNEGFATLYESTIPSIVYPEFNTIDFFIFETVQNALQVDALETTRPMTQPVSNPIDIRNLFDRIAYDKSGSVLRMLQHAFTEKIWVNGLNKYLNAMQLKAATSEDLATYLDKAIEKSEILMPKEKTAKDILHSWSEKVGYPLIDVDREISGKIKIKQSKFTYKVSSETSKEEDIKFWIVPINIAVQQSNLSQFDETQPTHWLTDDQTLDIELNTIKDNEWIILNKQLTGFYRVNYDEKTWNLLIQYLNGSDFENIHHINRAQLVDDIINLARANKQKYELVFNLLQYLKKEKHFTPWTSASIGLSYINRLMADSEKYNLFQRFIRELVEPIYKELGAYDQGLSENLSSKQLRTIAVDWACLANSEQCIADTKKRVEEVTTNEVAREIEPDIRYNVYCSGLRQTTNEGYKSVFMKFDKLTDQTERTVLINAMGCIESEEIQKIYLDTTVNTNADKTYRIQEKNRVLQGVSNNGKVGLETAMAFVSEKHAEIEKGYNPPTPVKNLVAAMASRVASDAQKKTYGDLLDKLKTANYFEADEVTKILEVADENIKWVQDNQGEINEYLENYFNSAPITAFSFLMLTFMLTMQYLFN